MAVSGPTLAAREVIESGGGGAWRRGTAAVVVTLVAVLVASWWLDGRARAGELEELTARVIDAQSAIVAADGNVASMVEYGSPLLVSTRVDPAVRSDLQHLVQRAAADGARSLRAERVRVAGVRVLSWHGSLEAARAAYLSYLDARIAGLDALAADIAARRLLHPELTVLLTLARDAARTAAPGDGPANRLVDALAPGVGG